MALKTSKNVYKGLLTSLQDQYPNMNIEGGETGAYDDYGNSERLIFCEFNSMFSNEKATDGKVLNCAYDFTLFIKTDISLFDFIDGIFEKLNGHAFISETKSGINKVMMIELKQGIVQNEYDEGLIQISLTIIPVR